MPRAKKDTASPSMAIVTKPLKKFNADAAQVYNEDPSGIYKITMNYAGMQTVFEGHKLPHDLAPGSYETELVKLDEKGNTIRTIFAGVVESPAIIHTPGNGPTLDLDSVRQELQGRVDEVHRIRDELSEKRDRETKEFFAEMYKLQDLSHKQTLQFMESKLTQAIESKEKEMEREREFHKREMELRANPETQADLAKWERIERFGGMFLDWLDPLREPLAFYLQNAVVANPRLPHAQPAVQSSGPVTSLQGSSAAVETEAPAGGPVTSL